MSRAVRESVLDQHQHQLVVSSLALQNASHVHHVAIVADAVLHRRHVARRAVRNIQGRAPGDAERA